MSAIDNSKKYTLVYVLLWIVTIIITVTVALLIIQPDNRNGKFYISLISILIAESFIFGYPVFSKLTNVNTPLVLGGYIIFWFYGLATLILSYIATTNIAFSLLLAIHLIILSTRINIGRILSF